jgi:ABC-type multidrug transport system fused ATPase/permease subunit
MVVGPVGCGKSTLISSLMGETILNGGSLRIGNKICYSSQEPLIMADTVENNIIFGNPLDEAKVKMSIEACSLNHDISQSLNNGLQTTIGEGGVNISGGQKARISLCRAVYEDGDIYLLDDPLSAVDP